MSAQTEHLLQVAARRPLTIDDLPADDDLGRAELIDGSLFVTPLGDLEHQVLATNMAADLRPVVLSHLVAVAGVNVIRGDGTMVIPDVAVIDPSALIRDGLGVSPEGLILAVEITSPSTRRRDLTIKRDLFREWNIPLLIVDRQVTPYAHTTFGDWPDWAAILLP